MSSENDEYRGFLKKLKSGMTYDDFDVSQPTARKIISELRDEGYRIETERMAHGKKKFYLKSDQKLDKAMTTSMKRQCSEQGRKMYNDMVDALNEIYKQFDTHEKDEVEDMDEDETAVLYVGDIHFGAVEKDDDGERIYDSQKAKGKIDQLYKNTKKMTDFIQENKDIVEFDIAFLGDIIENDIIFENQKYEIDDTPLNQVKDAVESFIPFIKDYAEEFDQVRVYAVRGNHGRMADESHDSSNWDNIFYHMLNLGLKDEDNVYMDIAEGEWNEFEVYNKNIGITHGKNLHYQAGTSAGEKKFLRQFDSRDLDEIHLGHYHSRKSDEVLGKTIYWNGAIKPSGDFEGKLGVDSVPSQTLMTYSQDRGTTGVFFIDLRDDEEDKDVQL